MRLPTRDYYLDNSTKMAAIREAYVQYGKTVAELFGADPTTAETDMRQVLDLDIDLAQVSDEMYLKE